MMEAVSADMLSFMLPVSALVAAVLLTVAVVFWLGSGKQQSFEQAQRQARKKAEEVLKEREHVSPRAKKSRKNFRKKKSSETQEEPEPVAPRKGILKVPSVTSTVEAASPERPTPNKVEFKLDTTPPKDESGAPRTISPPTPYPSRESTSLPQPPPPAPEPAVVPVAPVKPAQPVFDEPKKAPAKQQQRVESQRAKPAAVKAAVKAPVQETQRPKVVETVPKAADSKKKSDGAAPPKKSKASKVKSLALVEGGQDVLPAYRITDIVGASPLSDEEIQRLIEILLEKSNANSEWEAANLKAESNKSLKKQNQELHSKLEEAHREVSGHANKIKELRKELQSEKTKHQSVEQSLQMKITQQANEISIFKTRAAGLEEELRQTKALAGPQSLEKMRDENARLAAQVTHLQQQVGPLSSQLKELAESNRAKDIALKATDPTLLNKVAEKESLLEHRNREIEQLNSTIQHSHTELMRMKKSLAETSDNRDVLKQRVELLESAQAQLVAENSSVKGDVAKRMEALREEYDQNRDQEIAHERAEMQAQHQEEVDRLKAEIDTLKKGLVEVDSLKQSLVEVESLKKGAAEVETLRESVGALEGRNRELGAQVERCASLEQQVASLSQQVEAERVAKKALQEELELQAKSKPNGPVTIEPLSNGGEAAAIEAEKEVAILEKKLEDLKNKNNELSESLWKAKDEAGATEKALERKLKQAQEQVESTAASARSEVLAQAREGQRALLRQLFPGVAVAEEGGDSKYEMWLERFEAEAQDVMSRKEEENASLKEKVGDMEVQREENDKEIRHFRDTLQATMEILKKLQAEVETTNAQHQVKLEEKEAALEAERTTNKRLQEELKQEREAVGQVAGELEQEKQAASRIQQELELSRAQMEGGAADREEVTRLESRLQDVEQSRKDKEEEVANLREVIKKKEDAEQMFASRLEEEGKLREEAVSKTDMLIQEKQELTERLNTMKQSNRQLNAQIANLAGPSPTDSEV